MLLAAITITRRYAAWGGDAGYLERVIVWTVMLSFVLGNSHQTYPVNS